MNVDFKLYLITDRTQAKMPLPVAVRLALEGGVRAIQVREKDLPIRELLSLSQELRTITREFGAKLFINDRIDVAITVGADGVHLGHQSMPVEAAKKILPGNMLIGVSTHNLQEARDAEKGGADFITFGPIFETPSKEKFGKPLGIAVLKDVVQEINIPVFGLGGLKSSTLRQVLGAGAAGVAMISAILAAEDVRTAARKVLDAITVIDKILCDQCCPR